MKKIIFSVTISIFLASCRSGSDGSDKKKIIYGTPDFALYNIEIQPLGSIHGQPIYEGSLIVISGLIGNSGDNYKGNPINVAAYVSNQPIPVYNVPNESVSPDEIYMKNTSKPFILKIFAYKEGDVQIKIKADVNEDAVETNEANNETSIDIHVEKFTTPPGRSVFNG